MIPVRRENSEQSRVELETIYGFANEPFIQEYDLIPAMFSLADVLRLSPTCDCFGDSREVIFKLEDRIPPLLPYRIPNKNKGNRKKCLPKS
jgi:hypothetical protein